MCRPGVTGGLLVQAVRQLRAEQIDASAICAVDDTAAGRALIVVDRRGSSEQMRITEIEDDFAAVVVLHPERHPLLVAIGQADTSRGIACRRLVVGDSGAQRNLVRESLPD